MATGTKNGSRKTIGYIECAQAELRGRSGRPFFRIRLEAAQTSDLLRLLKRCAASPNREWFALTSTHEKPERLKLTEQRTPNYEINAAPLYLRGEPVRISGDEGSCNIDFSGAVGGVLLMERLRSAQRRMRRFVEIRIPSRKRNLIEFIPDTDLEAMESAEHQRLAQAGGALAADTWSNEDFSDWESQDG